MLSIFIVNYKNPPLLRLCLQSLARVQLRIPFEVIVVDVETSIETQNVVREEFTSVFERIQLLQFKENIGFTRGFNEGLRASRGDVLFHMNADIILESGALEQMYEYIKQNPQVGLLGPRLLNIDDSRQDSCFRFYTPLTILYRRIGHLPLARKIIDPFLMRNADLSKPIEVDWVMGSALMTRRDVLERIGFMDERFFLYFSEVDWAHRFWENGYAVVYYPFAALHHYHRRQSKGRFGIFDLLLYREARWHLADGICYFRKYGLMPRRSPILSHGIA